MLDVELAALAGWSAVGCPRRRGRSNRATAMAPTPRAASPSSSARRTTTSRRSSTRLPRRSGRTDAGSTSASHRRMSRHRALARRPGSGRARARGDRARVPASSSSRQRRTGRRSASAARTVSTRSRRHSGSSSPAGRSRSTGTACGSSMRSRVRVGKLSGAVGQYAAIDPEVERIACERLGLEPAPSSTQILQRDRHAELLSALALVGSSLERFAVEIRHLARTEVREVEEPFGRGQKGSSAMPHKRNPIVSERICGLARVLRGNAQVGLENVALWHERDISHSSAERIVLPDSFLAVDYALDRFAWLVEGLVVRPARMRESRVEPRPVLQSAAAARTRRRAASRGTPPTGSCSATRCARGRRGSTSGGSCAATPRFRRASTSTSVFDLGAYTATSTRCSTGCERDRGARPSMPEAVRLRAGRSARSTRSVRTSCSSSHPIASRPSTSCFRPRSPTRAACSRACRLLVRADARHRRQPPRRDAPGRGRSSAGASRCCRSSSSSAATSPARAGSSIADRVDLRAIGPPGLVEADRLPEPILTPATKAIEGHDLNITEAEAEALCGRGRVWRCP